MALWLVRAGKLGESQKKFLEAERVYLTWEGLGRDLPTIETKGQLRSLLENVYPDAPTGRISNKICQIWASSASIEGGDRVILPSKNTKPPGTEITNPVPQLMN